MNYKEITRDIIAIIIILLAGASLFFATQAGSTEVIRTLAGAVVGYYFGTSQTPLGGAIKNVFKKNK